MSQRSCTPRKNYLRLADWVAALILIWSILAVSPLRWWGYDPGEIYVQDTKPGVPAELLFNREIRNRITLRYSVVVRNLQTRQTVCEDRSLPFTYTPGSRLPDPLLMSWWAAGDPRCSSLGLGGPYQMETCWIATNLLFGLLPDKQACRVSNVFTVKES